MPGDACAMLPTMAGVAAGFKPTAALTTAMVVCLRVLASALATSSAALAGSSAEVAVLKMPKAGLAAVLSPAFTPVAIAKASAAVKKILLFDVFINSYGVRHNNHPIKPTNNLPKSVS